MPLFQGAASDSDALRYNMCYLLSQTHLMTPTHTELPLWSVCTWTYYSYYQPLQRELKAYGFPSAILPDNQGVAALCYPKAPDSKIPQMETQQREAGSE